MHMEPVHACRHILQSHFPTYTLIPTVYRALLKSAVPGTDHRIHTTKKTIWMQQTVTVIMAVALQMLHGSVKDNNTGSVTVQQAS